jgi:threonylcarbamoyladenosine tRNA methylthiotransferase MtaB
MVARTVAIITLGCKVNQYEAAAFQDGFEAAGLKVVTGNRSADLVVINSCAVTATAAAQSNQTLRQALRRNPAAAVVLTGCQVELAADELAALAELRGRTLTLIGNSCKDQLVAAALAAQPGQCHRLLGEIATARRICPLPVRSFVGRTRALLRIQDGCESFCSYCIVPYTRGPSRSLPLAEAVAQAKTLATAGHREIVLTGIHLGTYGRDLSPSLDLSTLLDCLSRATPDTSYRISSLEPLEIETKLLDLMVARDNIQPHLHIPLQSGDDQILARMNRRYNTAQFARVVKLCRQALPDAGIGIDVLTGFPGESEEQFARAFAFIASLECSYLHVFPYSPRAGTAAAGFPDQVKKTVKEERARELRQLGREKRHDFQQRHLGRSMTVLAEGRRDSDGLLHGFTGNYIPVHFPGPDSLRHTRVTVRLLRLEEEKVIGERRA